MGAPLNQSQIINNFQVTTFQVLVFIYGVRILTNIYKFDRHGKTFASCQRILGPHTTSDITTSRKVINPSKYHEDRVTLNLSPCGWMIHRLKLFNSLLLWLIYTFVFTDISNFTQILLSDVIGYGAWLLWLWVANTLCGANLWNACSPQEGFPQQFPFRLYFINDNGAPHAQYFRF